MYQFIKGQKIPSDYQKLFQKNSDGVEVITGERIDVILHLNNISKKEIRSFEEGNFDLYYSLVEDIPFLVFDFGSFRFDCNIKNIHERNKEDNAMFIYFVDSSDKTLKSMRFVGVKHEIIESLIEDTTKTEKYSKSAFERKVLAIQSVKSTNDIMKICKIKQTFKEN